MTCLELSENDSKSSCADLIRASTSLFRAPEGVDGWVKPDQDETGEMTPFLLSPQVFRGKTYVFCRNAE
jgi:hypothetical protein